MKKLSMLMLAVASTIWISCNNNPAKENNQEEHSEMSHAHEEGNHHGEHIYTCPMGCEGGQSNKPGKCPKCGMDLVHSDKSLNNKKYFIDYKAIPTELEAGMEGMLSFTPKDAANSDAPVPLDIVHDKKIHLIIVSKDLSYFEHIHPEYQSDGSYRIEVLPKDKDYTNGIGHNETKFPYGGEYIMFQDYAPTGSGHQLSRIPITMKGKEKAPVKYTKENLGWSKDGYKVDLSFDKKSLKAKEMAGLKVNITKGGKLVTNLENYLGALGHMVVISENTEKYLHVHPMDSETKGPAILFHSTFDEPGIYRAFLQFKHDGKLQTADYVIQVQ